MTALLLTPTYNTSDHILLEHLLNILPKVTDTTKWSTNEEMCLKGTDIFGQMLDGFIWNYTVSSNYSLFS